MVHLSNRMARLNAGFSLADEAVRKGRNSPVTIVVTAANDGEEKTADQ